MAQQTINVGAAPNDGTGTPLRTAFQYTNSNFSELYTAVGPSGNNIVCPGSATITGNSTVGGSLGITGALTAYTGQVPSAIRAAASDYAAVAFDGATANTRISSACQAIGTGDFSMWSRFRVPTSIPSGQFPGVLSLTDSNTTTSRANAFRLVMTDAGSLQISRFGVTTGDVRTASIVGFRAAYSGQVVDIVVTRTGATLKVYINGTDTSYTDTASGTTPPAWSDTVVSDFVMIGATSASATTIFTGRIYRSVVFNRALSASDVTEVITTGVNPADQWGTQTQVIGYNPAVLNGGFETNSLNAIGTWAASALGTSTATIDTSGSFSRTGTNAGKLTLDGSGSYASFLANNGATNLLAVNKRYRFSFWARKGATSGSCGVQFGNTSSGAAYGNTGLVLTTSYANTVAEVITVNDGGFTISRQGGSAALSEIYIDDVEITRIGAIVDLDFTVGGGSTAYDRSTNGLDGTLFGGVSWTMPRDGQYINGPSTITGDLTVRTNKLAVTSTGVGAGTATPATALQVVGEIRSSADISNSSDAILYSYNGGTAGTVRAGIQLIGSTPEIRSYLSGTTAMTLNSTGLGIGVTPSAWVSSSKAIDIAAWAGVGYIASSAATVITNNTYKDAASNWVFKNGTNAAGYFEIAQNLYRWWQAPAAGGAGTTAAMVQAMTLDASGNLGIGVAPSAWNTGYSVFQVGIAASLSAYKATNYDQLTFGCNHFENTSGQWRYTNNGYACQYLQLSGQHIFRIAGNNTSGANQPLTWTQAMTLDASGNLGIGIATPTYKLDTQVAGGADRSIIRAAVTGVSGGFNVNWNHATLKTRVIIENIPTSSAGLPAGTLWNDAGTIKIA